MKTSKIILTDHARQRMKLRHITEKMIADVIRKPDRQQTETDGDEEFIRTLKDRKVHVIAKYLDDEKKWLVKTTWVRGEDDPKPLWVRILFYPVQLLMKLLMLFAGRKDRKQGKKRRQN